VVEGDDLHKSNIGTLRKNRVVFKCFSKRIDRGGLDIVNDDNSVRITHRYGRKRPYRRVNGDVIQG